MKYERVTFSSMADQKTSPKKKSSEKKWIFGILIVLVIFLLYLILSYLGLNDYINNLIGLSGLVIGFITLFIQCKKDKKETVSNDIQRFENYFNQQISLNKDIKNNIRTYRHTGKDALDMVYMNLIKILTNIDSNIRHAEMLKSGKNKVTVVSGMDSVAYDSIHFNPIGCLDVLGIQFTQIKKWLDSTYNLFLLIINEKCLNDGDRKKFLSLVKDNFSEKEIYILYFAGKLLRYNSILSYFLNEGLFEKDELIEKISKENIQFLQNEMKLKSNPSLESCEINL